MIFPKIQFPFKSKDLFTFKSKHFLQGLAETCSAGSYEEKCLLSKLVSPAILNLQNTLQNLACCFPESNLAIHLSAQNSSSAKSPDFCM
jgi:hypothetical protein